MATLTTWKLEQVTLQAGNGKLKLLAAGAGANEVINLAVRCPDQSVTKWDVTADEGGFIVAELVLANGLGLYTISFDTAFPCGESLTPCYDNPDLVCEVISCAVSAAVPSLKLEASKSHVNLGEAVTLYIKGTAGAVATIIQTWEGGGKPYVVTLDNAGVGSVVVEVKSFFDSFLAMANGLTSETITLEVDQGINIPAPVAPDLVLALAQIGTYNFQQDTVQAIVIRATNFSLVTQYLTLAPQAGDMQIELPVAIADTPILSGGFKEFTIFLSGHHSNIATTLMTKLLSGIYRPTTSGAGTATSLLLQAEVAPREMLSKFALTELTFLPSSCEVNDLVIVRMKLRNLGETDLTLGLLAPIQLSGVLGTIGFNNVNIPRGAIVTEDVTIKMLTSGTKVFPLDASTMTAFDGIASVVGTGELATTITVN